MDGAAGAAGMPGDVGKTFSEFSKHHFGFDQRPRAGAFLFKDEGRPLAVLVEWKEVFCLIVFCGK